MGVLDLFKLNGKVALVTGCSRGIGKSMAIALAEAGCDIVGVSASLENNGSKVEREITSLGRKFTGYSCDFSDRTAIYKFIEQVKKVHPRIDVLVNNAGTIFRSPISEHSDEHWDKIINVNLSAQFILSREIGKEMVARGNGKIIFQASLLTYQGGLNVPSYAASKGGIGQLVKAFSNEWASKGVQINGIAPGYIATDVNEALRVDGNRYDSIISRIPANRWGEPSDLMGIIVFLASAASDYMNGEIVTVDGGWMGR